MVDAHDLVSWGNMRQDEKIKALRKANTTLRVNGRMSDLEPKERLAVLLSISNLFNQLNK